MLGSISRRISGGVSAHTAAAAAAGGQRRFARAGGALDLDALLGKISKSVTLAPPTRPKAAVPAAAVAKSPSSRKATAAAAASLKKKAPAAKTVKPTSAKAVAAPAGRNKKAPALAAVKSSGGKKSASPAAVELDLDALVDLPTPSKATAKSSTAQRAGQQQQPEATGASSAAATTMPVAFNPVEDLDVASLIADATASTTTAVNALAPSAATVALVTPSEPIVVKNASGSIIAFVGGFCVLRLSTSLPPSICTTFHDIVLAGVPEGHSFACGDKVLCDLALNPLHAKFSESNHVMGIRVRLAP